MTTPAQPPTPPQLGKPRTRHYKERITITIDPHLLLELDGRGEERSAVLSRDLTRYYALMRVARIQLREQFLPAELSLLLDAFNGHIFTPNVPIGSEMSSTVEAAFRLDDLDTKWLVDSSILLEKLHNLETPAILALADAIERFWVAMGHGDQVDAARALD